MNSHRGWAIHLAAVACGVVTIVVGCSSSDGGAGASSRNEDGCKALSTCPPEASADGGGPAQGGPSEGGGPSDAAPADAGPACTYPMANCKAGSSTCETRLLDDPANCGACGHDCLGGGCLSGICQSFIFSRAVGSPNSSLVRFEDGLYWVQENFQPGTVVIVPGASAWKLALADGKVTQLGIETTISPAPGDIAVGAQGVYMAGENAESQLGEDVFFPNTGTPVTVSKTHGLLTDSIALGPTALFIATLTRSKPAQTSIARMPVGGAPSPMTTFDDYLGGFAVNGDYLYARRSITNSGPRVDEILRAPTSGGPFAKVFDDNVIGAVTYSGKSVFYFSMPPNGGPGKIKQGDLESGATTVVVEGVAQASDVLLVDADALYWIADAEGLRRARRAGGPSVVLVPDATRRMLNLLQDDKALYWLEGDVGGGLDLFKLAK